MASRLQDVSTQSYAQLILAQFRKDRIVMAQRNRDGVVTRSGIVIKVNPAPRQVIITAELDDRPRRSPALVLQRGFLMNCPLSVEALLRPVIHSEVAAAYYLKNEIHTRTPRVIAPVPIGPWLDKLLGRRPRR